MTARDRNYLENCAAKYQRFDFSPMAALGAQIVRIWLDCARLSYLGKALRISVSEFESLG